MRLLTFSVGLFVALVVGPALLRKQDRRGWMCRFRGGHTDVIYFKGPLIVLRCMDCGRETDGWNLAIGRAERRRGVA